VHCADVVDQVAGRVEHEDAVALPVARGEALDSDLVGVVDDDAVLRLRPLEARPVEDDLLRVALVADQAQVALAGTEDLDAFVVGAIGELDGVARPRLVDGLLDAVEASMRPDLQRAVRPGRGLLHLAGVGRGGVVDRKRGACGRERAREGEPARERVLHGESLFQDGSTRYQPAMPESWWGNTWQW
jgi:hypothetical protein